MAQITLDVYRSHPHQQIESGDDPVATYAAAHGAIESDACNTGGYRNVGQSHRRPGVYLHEFSIYRLGKFFWINVPSGSTITAATLVLRMRKRTNIFGDVDWDWTLSIRHNDGLSGPGEAGGCPTTDYPIYLDGTQFASKYVDDLTTSEAPYEFNVPTSIVIPQTYLKLALMSSKDLAGVAPDDTVYIVEEVWFTGVQQLILEYTPPTTEVETNPATLITGVSATLNGTLIDGGGEACDCSFEWGLTDAYGETTTPVSKETGETFSAGITGLVSGTTYHFRAKAVNSFDTFYGADLTFTCLGYFAWII